MHNIAQAKKNSRRSGRCFERRQPSGSPPESDTVHEMLLLVLDPDLWPGIQNMIRFEI